MRPTEGVVPAAAVPGRAAQSAPPAAVLCTVPAHLGFLPTIRTALGTLAEELGETNARARDLQLAADEVAAVLIDDASAWTQLQLSIAHDETDIYVRIVTRRARPGRRLVVHELTQLLLRSAVASYELFADDQLGYAFLQIPRDGADSLR